ncbi:MAG: 50S ribosomal protein L19 [Parachlamydiales bacterium]|nr:50S ribosomal protein L19 [Parachlamydiales bacterium]
MKEFEQTFLKKDVPDFNVGDTVRVHTKVIEGEKERIQVFLGIVIAKKGKGLSKTFTVYRSAYGCSMERVFLVHSPKVTKIEIERKGKVKRSKLYHIRGKSGKKSKVKEKIFKKIGLEAFLEPQEEIEPITEEIVGEIEESTDSKQPEKKAKKSKTENKKEEKPKKEKKPKQEN